MHPTLRSRTRKVFAVQLYKNNARAPLARILSILNSDWLQHVVYGECMIVKKSRHNFRIPYAPYSFRVRVRIRIKLRLGLGLELEIRVRIKD